MSRSSAGRYAAFDFAANVFDEHFTDGLAGSCYFRYGTSSTALTTSTAKTTLAASSARVPVATQIAGLEAKTTTTIRSS